MKQLTLIVALACAITAFSKDQFFGPVVPRSTVRVIIDQAVKEAKAYTDSKVSTNGTAVVESDPTVPAWAKEENKPTYNATEIIYGNGFVADYLSELTGTVATKADTSALTAISTAVADKADKADVYTKTQADSTFLTSHQDLSDYAKKSDVYDKTSIDTALDNALARIALLEALIPENAVGIKTEGAVVYNDATKDLALAGTIEGSSVITANSLKVNELQGSASPTNGAAIDVTAGEVTIKNSVLAGTTQEHHEFIRVKGAEEMVVEGVRFTGDTYNTIMTGQQTTKFLKKLTIKNCTFDENCKHINVWFAGFQEGAVLEIKDCTFKTCEQFLCISDFHGTEARTLTVNIENVNILNYEKDGSQYEGIMFVDDRTCTSSAQLRSVNPFSKVTINLKNVTAGGTKLTAANFGIGTGTTGQQLYYYSAKGGGVYLYNETNASLFPTVNVTE